MGIVIKDTQDRDWRTSDGTVVLGGSVAASESISEVAWIKDCALRWTLVNSERLRGACRRSIPLGPTISSLFVLCRPD